MAYTEEAIQRRRCTARRKDGCPCRAWACWDDPEQRCMAQAGRHHTGPMKPVRMQTYEELQAKWARERTRFQPCNCVAYNWPHRPGGGLCRWPNSPEYRRTTPAGTQSPWRSWKRRSIGR